jgi:ATP-dependent RNA helicase RhlE
MFKSFQDLGVSEAVVDALEKVGVVAPFPVQALVMRDAMSGADVLAKSETGSGKTLAFAIPIVERLDPSASKRPMALVLVPTRELAVQVRDDFAPIAKAKGLKMAVAYGGTGVREQAKGLSEAHIVVATPGRLQDYAERGDIKLDAVETFVLDEADRMLDMGFLPQVDRIVRRLPKDRQTMFFSATLDGDVGRIAAAFTRNAIRHEVVSDSKTAEMIDHRFVPVDPHDRVDKLIELLHEEERELALVFVRTKRGADRLVKQLKAKDVNASAMHGDMPQQARERALKRFEEGKVDVLIATDVAARGLDLYAITHVINYDPPEDDKGYVHRVGRTARAGRSGISITLVSAEQQGDVSRMAARLDLSDEFQEEGMKVAPPRMVFSGSRGGRRSGLRKPTRRR